MINITTPVGSDLITKFFTSTFAAGYQGSPKYTFALYRVNGVLFIDR